MRKLLPAIELILAYLGAKECPHKLAGQAHSVLENRLGAYKLLRGAFDAPQKPEAVMEADGTELYLPVVRICGRPAMLVKTGGGYMLAVS